MGILLLVLAYFAIVFLLAALTVAVGLWLVRWKQRREGQNRGGRR